MVSIGLHTGVRSLYVCTFLLILSSFLLLSPPAYSFSFSRSRGFSRVAAFGINRETDRHRNKHGKRLHASSGNGEIFGSADGNPTSMLEQSSSTGETETFGNSLRLNWQHGVCKHVNAFEGTQHIRKLRFEGDTMAIAMVDGRCCLVSRSFSSQS